MSQRGNEQAVSELRRSQRNAGTLCFLPGHSCVSLFCFEGSNQCQRPRCFKHLSSPFHFAPHAGFFFFFSLHSCRQPLQKRPSGPCAEPFCFAFDRLCRVAPLVYFSNIAEVLVFLFPFPTSSFPLFSIFFFFTSSSASVDAPPMPS